MELSRFYEVQQQFKEPLEFNLASFIEHIHRAGTVGEEKR